MSLIGIKEKSGREDTEEWNKMKKLEHDCIKMGVKVPEEVYDYFREHEEEKEVIIEHYEEIEVDMGQGIEINVIDIPENVVTLRFKYQH